MFGQFCQLLLQIWNIVGTNISLKARGFMRFGVTVAPVNNAKIFPKKNHGAVAGEQILKKSYGLLLTNIKGKKEKLP